MKKGSSSSSIASRPDKSRPGRPKPDALKKKKNECYCGRKFSSTEAYLVHQQTHAPRCASSGSGVEEKVEEKLEGLDINTATCDVCDRSFNDPVDFRRHYCPSPPPSSSSDEDEDEDKKRKRSTCSICGDTFKTIRSFAYHQRYCLPRGEDEEDIIDEPWLDGERLEFLSRRFAEAALLYLKNNDSLDYKLVKPGPFQTADISRGPIAHLNFRAKAKDCPDAQVHTFFAQLRMYPPGHPFVVDCCLTLGTDVPHFTKAETYGCTYCQCAVHHPHPDIKCPKLFKGVDSKDSSWLYGDELHVSSLGDDIDDEDGGNGDGDDSSSGGDL